MSTATAAPELVGFFATGSRAFFGLRDSPGKGLAWHSIGDRFGEYEVVSFDINADTVRLRHGATITDLKLKDSRVESPPTIALVEQLAMNGDPDMQKLLPGLRTLESRRVHSVEELSALERRVPRDEEAQQEILILRRKIQLQQDHLDFLLRAVVKSRKTPDK